MLDDKVYNTYDAVVSYLMYEIREKVEDNKLFGNNKIFGLENFSPESREHLVVAWAAMYVAGMTNKQVALNIPFWKYLKFKIKFKGMHKFYCWRSKNKDINVPQLIGSIYTHINGADYFKAGIGCIYDEYYAPRKVKHD